MDQLIPRAGSAHQDASAEHEARRGEAGDGEPITFDLAKLAAIEAPERELLRRYIGMIQVQRDDFNGRVITVVFEGAPPVSHWHGTSVASGTTTERSGCRGHWSP